MVPDFWFPLIAFFSAIFFSFGDIFGDFFTNLFGGGA